MAFSESRTLSKSAFPIFKKRNSFIYALLKYSHRTAQFFRKRLNEPPIIEPEKTEKAFNGLIIKRQVFLESFLSKDLLKSHLFKKNNIVGNASEPIKLTGLAFFLINNKPSKVESARMINPLNESK